MGAINTHIDKVKLFPNAWEKKKTGPEIEAESLGVADQRSNCSCNRSAIDTVSLFGVIRFRCQRFSIPGLPGLQCRGDSKF